MESMLIMPASEFRQIIRSEIDAALDKLPIVQTVPGEEYLSKQATMKILGVSNTTLWRLDKSGELKPVRIGRVIRYRRVDVDAYAERSLAV